MVSYLEYLAETLRADAPIRPWFDLLRSPGEDQITILRWCQKTIDGIDGMSTARRPYAESVPPDMDVIVWESRLMHFAMMLTDEDHKLSPWDKASTERRAAHCKLIADLARQLADELSKEDAPPYPSALGLFEDEPARWMLQQLQPGRSGGSFSPRDDLERAGFADPQGMPGLLRRLAECADERRDWPKPNPRPNSGISPDAREFALLVAYELDSQYSRKPYPVIAACVRLKYPAIQHPPPNADHVRGWLGDR